MASQTVALLNQIPNRHRITVTACALALLSTLAGCDQKFAVDDPFTESQGGTSSSAGAIGGAAGTTADQTTSTAGAAGTKNTSVVATGGMGGQAWTTPVPAGCAPISTSPGVVDPCGHAFGVAYSPDGQWLAVGGDGVSPSFRVWRLADGMPLPDFSAQSPLPTTTYGLTFSPDSKTLAVAGEVNDNTGETAVVQLWNVATGALIRALAPSTANYADSVAFSNDGSLLLTGGELGPVQLWRVADASLVRSIDVPSTAHNVHFSPDNSKIIVASYSGEARLFDVASGALVLGPLAIAVEMADAEMSPDGAQLATTWQSGNADNSVRIYNATTGALVQSLAGHTAYISRVVWIDQNRVVSGDWGGQVILWRRGADGTFALAKTWSTGGQSLGIGISPDKTTIVTGGSGGKGQGFVFLTL